MNFCDYCSCESCVTGNAEFTIHHAQTLNGKWICDVCYAYDLCTSGPTRNPNGPCDDKLCKHRPRLISGWKKK